jgi:hypothetical protein
MMQRFGLSLGSGAFLLILVGLATAQRPTPVAPAPADKPVPPAVDFKNDSQPPEVVPPGTLRDPTKPSSRMKDVLNTKAGAGMKITPLSLRGRVIARGQPAAALLEVEGRLYTVSKGSVITGAHNTILRVLDIDATGVRIESSPSKEIFVLR